MNNYENLTNKQLAGKLDLSPKQRTWLIMLHQAPSFRMVHMNAGHHLHWHRKDLGPALKELVGRLCATQELDEAKALIELALGVTPPPVRVPQTPDRRELNRLFRERRAEFQELVKQASDPWSAFLDDLLKVENPIRLQELLIERVIEATSKKAPHAPNKATQKLIDKINELLGMQHVVVLWMEFAALLAPLDLAARRLKCSVEDLQPQEKETSHA